MPGYDGSGPEGIGPSGRGMGPCGQGRASGPRRFLGFRRGGRGRGWGFRWFNRLPVDEKEALESEKNWLTDRLEAIRQRMDDLPPE